MRTNRIQSQANIVSTSSTQGKTERQLDQEIEEARRKAASSMPMSRDQQLAAEKRQRV